MTRKRWLTITEAADEMDYSVRQLQEYAKRPGCPRRKRGASWEYEWPAFNRFVREAAVADAVERVKPADFEEARARKEAANAELAELDLAERRGQLVTREGARKAMASLCERVRARLVTLPPKVAPLVVGCDTVPQAQRELERAVEEVLAELRGEGTTNEEARAA